MRHRTYAWITRDALTHGIGYVEISVREDSNYANTTYGDVLFPHEWHDTREEAVKVAEQMRADAIAEHELKINLLKGLKF